MKSNKQIIQERIIDNPKIQQAFNKNCNGSQWKQDLYPEVIMIYMEMDNEKLNKLYDKGESQFRYHFIRIVRNQLHSSSSPFYKKYREDLANSLNIDISDFFPADNDERYEEIVDIDPYEQQEHEWDMRIEDRVAEIYDKIKWNLHWYDRKLFDLYIEKQTDRGPIRRISEETLIPEQSVGNSIRNTKDILQKEINKELNKLK